MGQIMQKTIKFLAVIVLVAIAAILFPPVQMLIRGAFLALNATTQLVLKLAIVSVIAIVLGGLLSPLEALGWWAGWYGDRLDTAGLGTLQEPPAPGLPISRYIIYLDGVGQANFTYLPEGEEFLNLLAVALPDDIVIIRELMPYSVLNRSLTSGDRPLNWFWQLADRLRLKNPANILGTIINLRNMFIVAVSADQRYGPIYNRGMAQLMYDSLVNHGYQPQSGIPITLIGFSGGGQISMGAAPFLKEALAAPIDIISLGGVFCGRNPILKLEHLYHLVGEKDTVEGMGPLLFPRRWKLFFLSYWNRARLHGLVTLIPLEFVGHQIPGGLMDSNAFLPDGRSFMQQTVEWVSGIITGVLPPPETLPVRKISHYERYQAAAFNRPDYYPIPQPLDPELYRPVAAWMGRLILPKPEERQFLKGVWFEVLHAADEHSHLVGKIVRLCWEEDPVVQADVRSVTRDIHFSSDARYTLKQGLIHPERLNGWRLVGPLESLAGARPNDDVMVALENPILLAAEPSSRETPDRPEFVTTLAITQPPTQITGRFYTLAQFIQPTGTTADGTLYQVKHFNPISREFDRAESLVLMPQVIADVNDTCNSTSRDIEKSACNPAGWYLYGAQNAAGVFVVQAIAPRQLFRLQPDRAIVGKKAAMQYLTQECWADLPAKKGTVSSVLLRAKQHSPDVADWREGDRALLVHTYGGIGGNKCEPSAKGPVYFGHFAYGIAQVVREPLADELQFNLVYYQVYTHNTDGLIACRHHWSNYLGDRQFGWAGIRPVADLLIKLDSFTGDYDMDGVRRSPLNALIRQLDLMMARYRTGDGTGGTYVGPSHNCAQDSNQALYAAIQSILQLLRRSPEIQQWLADHPEMQTSLKQLRQVSRFLKQELLPLGTARADWQDGAENLGSSLEDSPLRQLITGLASWRTLLPRVASEAITRAFLRQGASVWVLRTNQVGGNDPDVEPIAPMRL